MTVSNFLTTDVVVSILVSVYSHKHRADYTTVHYMVHTTHYTLQTKSPKWSLFSWLVTYGIWTNEYFVLFLCCMHACTCIEIIYSGTSDKELPVLRAQYIKPLY